jgi:hypothetical protein
VAVIVVLRKTGAANLHHPQGVAVSERDRQAAIAALAERQRVIQARLLTKG